MTKWMKNNFFSHLLCNVLFDKWSATGFKCKKNIDVKLFRKNLVIVHFLLLWFYYFPRLIKTANNFEAPVHTIATCIFFVSCTFAREHTYTIINSNVLILLKIMVYPVFCIDVYKILRTIRKLYKLFLFLCRFCLRSLEPTCIC